MSPRRSCFLELCSPLFFPSGSSPRTPHLFSSVVPKAGFNIQPRSSWSCVEQMDNFASLPASLMCVLLTKGRALRLLFSPGYPTSAPQPQTGLFLSAGSSLIEGGLALFAAHAELWHFQQCRSNLWRFECPRAMVLLREGRSL